MRKVIKLLLNNNNNNNNDIYRAHFHKLLNALNTLKNKVKKAFIQNIFSQRKTVTHKNNNKVGINDIIKLNRMDTTL